MTTNKQVSITLTEEEKETLLKARNITENIMKQIDKNLAWYFKLSSSPNYESPNYGRNRLYETTYMLQYLGNCNAVNFSTKDEKYIKEGETN